jgi:hypothetical protein
MSKMLKNPEWSTKQLEENFGFFVFLAVVQLSVAHMRLTAVFVKSKKNRDEEEALNKNCSS